jgi:hypothetical protein
VSDTATVIAEIGADVESLDKIGKAIYSSTDEYCAAEEAWEEVYDQVAEALKEEMRDEQRKGDPAEHTIIAVARRQHRTTWVRYRRAKRDLERWERILQAKRASLNGRQSELAALRDEARVPDQSQSHQFQKPIGAKAA